MSLSTLGANTLAAEVSNISAFGFWVLVADREYFVPFAEYPDFRAATVEQIYRLENPSPSHLYWPELDVDIELDALDAPQRFPLNFRR